MTNEILETALALIGEGISVIPVIRSKSRELDKRPAFEVLPRGKDGKPTWMPFQNRLPTEDEVRGWFGKPRYNLAVVGGAVSGNLLMPDFDEEEPLTRWAKPRATLLAGVPVERTGRKGSGWHLYFRTDVLVPAAKGANFDLKSEGGYCICAPSVHGQTGKKYRIVRGSMMKLPVLEVATLNLEVLGANGTGGKAKDADWMVPLLENVPTGQRTNRLVQLVGRWIGKGLKAPEVIRLAHVTNDGWKEPLATEEVDRIVAGVAKTDVRKRQKRAAALPDLPSGTVTNLEVCVTPDKPLGRTDMGNGYSFIRAYGEDLRYCTRLDDGKGSGWFHFDGTRWKQDDNQVVPSLAKKAVHGLYELAWDSKDEKLAKHALSSASNSRIRAMLAQAMSCPGVPILPDVLDRDTMLFNVANGTLDLRTGELRPHSKPDMITLISPVEYNPAATCPRWDLFLLEIMDGDQEMATFLETLFGYCLTGSTRDDAYYTLHGRGCNGKSVLGETVAAVLGEYCAAAAEETFLIKRGERIKSDLARLYNRRLIFVPEVGRDQQLDESLVKRWTSGDTITVEKKYVNTYDVKPVGKVIFKTNHRPVITGQDEGIWRRTRLVPFSVSFEGRKDVELKDKLVLEASGILNRLLAGCARAQREGIRLPGKVVRASADYKAESDVLEDFFNRYLERGVAFSVTKAQAYALYVTYCKVTEQKPLTIKKFGSLLEDYPGIESDRTATAKIWTGIRERFDLVQREPGEE